uniref:Uncharacterized protein n=1 Tax=Romanomermis culicivorax TaxID=13658 RepID=A0A915KTF9_ROMCU
VKLPLKVIASIRTHTELFLKAAELFLKAANDNVLEEIPEAERYQFPFRNCQPWVTSSIFPTTTATIPDMIVQPLPTNSVAPELPIESAVINVTNGQGPLLFVNNTPNSIKLHPNQLLAVAKHMLGFSETHTDCQVATPAPDHDLTDHKLAALDKLLPCHFDQQKKGFALN